MSERHSTKPIIAQRSVNNVTSTGLTRRLSDTLQPVRPSAAFVSSLGRELVRDAAFSIEAWKRRKRTLTIVAAIVGSLLSIASLIGAIIYLNSRVSGEEDAEAAGQEP